GMAEEFDVNKTMVSEMCKHFREACQTWIVETNPVFLGGEGKHDCDDVRCEILILTETDKQFGYLLHNSNNRYQHGWPIPVKAGTFVFSEKVLNVPAGCQQSQNVQL
uniref:Uncharacterized protein n=1 Tax=Clytia hemisphaerica TaxID=252671 RepID=A0A7M6DND8_9CNID